MPFRIGVIQSAARYIANNRTGTVANDLNQAQGFGRQGLFGASGATEGDVFGVGVRAQQHNGAAGVVEIIK